MRSPSTMLGVRWDDKLWFGYRKLLTLAQIEQTHCFEIIIKQYFCIAIVRLHIPNS